MREPVDCLIVGGGPAGMVAGLLFARAGLDTIVLEKHGDFLRDFRGDTVHPSTLRLFDELGLLDRLLARPHDKVRKVTIPFGDHRFDIADFSRLPAPANFVALMPQWEFLDCVADVARGYPNFALHMNCEAVGVVADAGRIAGVALGDGQTIRSKLVVAADGRRSVLRGAAALPLEDLGAPMDVFWFRLEKPRTADNRTTGYFRPGHVVAMIDRGNYWQCAYLFPKGGASAVQAAGLPAFRSAVAEAAPPLASLVDQLTDPGGRSSC